MNEPKKRISELALKVWRISGVIKTVIGWAVTVFIIFLLNIFEAPSWISAILVALGVIFTFLNIFLFPLLRWKYWRYEVREEEIELQQGFFVRSRTLIPMIRIQHVDTVQGPLLRKYHLSSVVVATAATSHEIPALEEHEAEDMRFHISRLARIAEDDV